MKSWCVVFASAVTLKNLGTIRTVKSGHELIKNVWKLVLLLMQKGVHKAGLAHHEHCTVAHAADCQYANCQYILISIRSKLMSNESHPVAAGAAGERVMFAC
jgi:hypothetical protein